MTGFKIIIKATAQGYSKDKLEREIKSVIERTCGGISIKHIKAKGTNNLNLIDPVIELEKTIDRRNTSLWETESSLSKSEEEVADLKSQVEDLMRIIRDKEESCNRDDFCNCNDWRSVGSDPESGDKLKRCNICERVGVR
jgi:peptidoglycan hydrolase CwlO-like protein